MKRYLIIVLAGLLIAGCKKEKPEPADPNEKYYGIWETTRINFEFVLKSGVVVFDSTITREEMIEWDEPLDGDVCVDQLNLNSSQLQVKFFGDTATYTTPYILEDDLLYILEGGERFLFFQFETVDQTSIHYFFKEEGEYDVGEGAYYTNMSGIKK